MSSGKLKNAGNTLFGLAIMLVLMAIPAVFLVGAEWLSLRLLPWFFKACVLALAAVIAVALPLSFFTRTRGAATTITFVSSYIFGSTLWMWSLVLTLGLWGTLAAVIGVLFMGVGVVPIALLAAATKGMWAVVAQLFILLVLTFGMRILALWIASRGTAQEVEWQTG